MLPGLPIQSLDRTPSRLLGRGRARTGLTATALDVGAVADRNRLIILDRLPRLRDLEIHDADRATLLALRECGVHGGAETLLEDDLASAPLRAAGNDLLGTGRDHRAQA